MGDMRNAYKILFGKPEGKTTLKTWAKRERYIKMNLHEIRSGVWTGSGLL
jgi:hypothetical protein